jgi:hypothetical protein
MPSDADFKFAAGRPKIDIPSVDFLSHLRSRGQKPPAATPNP